MATEAKDGNVTVADPDKFGSSRCLVGIVKSDKMEKTVVVEVVSMHRDRVYGKYVKSRVRYKAHSPRNEYRVGDKVEIREHRPLSREKRWVVSAIVEKAKTE